MSEREFTAASFNQYLSEKRLMASLCQSCGHLNLPPRPLCARCRSQEMEWTETKGAGQLAAFTAIAIAPTEMVEAGYGRDNPYVSGIVTLEEGPSISARITGVDAREPEGIRLGTLVTVEFLELGEGDGKRTVLAFRPREG